MKIVSGYSNSLATGNDINGVVAKAASALRRPRTCQARRSQSTPSMRRGT